MTESTLTSLIQILTLLSKTRENSETIIERNMIISFLQKQFSENTVNRFTHLYEKFLDEYGQKQIPLKLVQKHVDGLTRSICKKLPFKERIYLLVNLIEFSKYLKRYLEQEDHLQHYDRDIERISSNFNVDGQTFKNCKSFTLGSFHLITQEKKLLIISGEKFGFVSNLKNIVLDGLEGMIHVYQCGQDLLLIKYSGSSRLFVDKLLVKKDLVYFFNISSALHLSDRSSLYFNDINKVYTQDIQVNLTFEAEDIGFSYTNSNNGIKPFSFKCESNEIVGIIGNSGTGKTTLLNLLSGSLPLHEGEIKVNGVKLQDGAMESGIIGYVPQDDILLEGLTVFDNLLYSAQLSKTWSTKQEITEKVNQVLEKVNLDEVKHLRVGSLSQKVISGGQRKRLNIAIEILREPSLLFIDEPTSGLSSTDAYHVVLLLKQLALGQKLLFVNIHQPSNDIFNLFDKIIVLDKGGYPIYFGRPGMALGYFREAAQKVETNRYGKFQSDQEEILSIIEETYVDDFGNKSAERFIDPEEWYARFKKSPDDTTKIEKVEINEDTSNISLPSLVQQYRTYFMRNLKSKLHDKQYLLLSLGVAPVLATVLALLCKQFVTSLGGNVNYVFGQNENMASFYFMSVIVAMFVGLIVSAEEVYRDRVLLIRERFLKLSRLGYYASKLTLLAALSAVQTLTYTLIAYAVLKISADFLVVWLALFLISFLANIIGLLISGALKSLVAIYIVIPLVLVPQILLSGIVVPYQKLNPAVASEEYTPVIGDVIPTRWAYEALIVNQFKNNLYQKYLYNIEELESKYSYAAYILLPELKSWLFEAAVSEKETEGSDWRIRLIISELSKYKSFRERFMVKNAFNYNLNANQKQELDLFIGQLQKSIIDKLNQIQKDKHDQLLTIAPGGNLEEMKNTHFNQNIADLVLGRNTIRYLSINDDEIIRKFEPIYKIPDHRLGRSHFYSGTKIFLGVKVNTIKFNFLILALMIIIGLALLGAKSKEKY